MSALAGALISAIGPKILDVVDKAVGDKDAATKIKAELSTALINNNTALVQAASSVVIAEATGESWLQRNWRPLMMIWFAFLIGAYWFGFVPANMPTSVVEQLFTLVQLGIGGYVVGRSGEKIATTIAPYLGGGKAP